MQRLFVIAALALCASFGFGAPRPSIAPTSHVATLTGTGSKSAAVSNAGTIVDIGGQTSFYAPGSATPTWQAPPTISFQSIVDAGGQTLASLRFEHASAAAPRIPTLRRYTPTSATPNLTYQFPFTVTSTTSGLHVSNDGQTLVAWVFSFQKRACINSTVPAMSTDLVIFQSGQANPSAYVSVYMAGDPKLSALSDDGRYLLLVSAIKRVVINLQTLTVPVDSWNTVQIGRECAIAPDGSMHAVASSKRYVDVWQGAAQRPSLDVGSDSVWCDGLDFAAGSLVVGWSNGRIDIGGGVINAPAPLTDIDASSDGLLLAAVAGGLTVYERSGSLWSKTFEQNAPGTADVEVSDTVMVTVAPSRVDMFKRGAVVPTMPQIEYRVAIQQSAAIPGSTHTAQGFNVATGQPAGGSITVKVE